jgi:ribosomal protein L24E
MATIIASANWDHNEMIQDIIMSIYYENYSRTTTKVSFDLYVKMYLGGTQSFWGYDAYYNATVKNQSTGERQIKPSSPPIVSGESIIKHIGRYEYEVGTSSGSIPVSVRIYSKTDTNDCGSGLTLSGSIAYSSTNTAPSAPTTITLSQSVYTENIPISWSGASDPEGQTLTYDVEVSKNNGSYTSVATGIPATSTSYNIGGQGEGDSEGTTYKFRVRSKDSMGYISSWKESGVVKKNTKPYNVSWVSIGESFSSTGTTVSWSAATDPDGQTISYKINIYKDDTLLTNVTTTSTSYSYTFPSDAKPKTKFSFGIITVDSMNYASSEVKSNYCTKIVPPPSPTILMPINNSTIYNTLPKIVIKINEDLNGEQQTLHVRWQNVEYYSTLHTDVFSKVYKFMKDDTLYFEPLVDGVIGKNTVIVWTDNGYYSSTPVSITINIAEPVLSYHEGNPIIPLYTEEIRDIVNTTLRAYGQDSKVVTTEAATNKIISLSDITKMRNVTQELFNILDQYNHKGSPRTISWTNRTKISYDDILDIFVKIVYF